MIKVVKQEMNNGSYYSIAQWEIPTLAWHTKSNNYFVFNAKVGFSTELYCNSYPCSSLVSLLFITWIPTSFINLFIIFNIIVNIYIYIYIYITLAWEFKGAARCLTCTLPGLYHWKAVCQ